MSQLIEWQEQICAITLYALIRFVKFNKVPWPPFRDTKMVFK